MIHKSSRLRDVITRYRVNGVTLRVLVFLSAAAAALSLLTLPDLSVPQLVAALLCLSLIALSAWWPPGRTAGWLLAAALACAAAAQAITTSPLLDYVFLALVVYGLTAMPPLGWTAYALSAYSLWTVLHYRAVDDVVLWLQSNLGFAVPVAAAITAGVVYRRSLRRLWQNDQSLQQMQLRAESLSTALQQLQQRVAAEERHRLAQQLSDDLQSAFTRTEQQFQTALSQLQANFGRAQASLDGARGAVAFALDRLRQAVAALRGSAEIDNATPVDQLYERRPAGSAGRRWLLLWLLPAAVVAAWPFRLLLDTTFGADRPRLIDAMLAPLNLLGLLLATGLVLTPLIVARVQLRRARLAEQRLAALAAMIEQRLAASRTHAVSGERARLARELHDELGSQLVLISLHLQLAGELAADDGPAAQQQLEQSQRVLQDAWQSLLQLIDADMTLSARNLREALDGLVAAAGRNSAAPISLSAAELPPTLSPAAAVCLYRVVQEGLTNALKYAPGAAIAIVLQVDAHQAQLSLTNQAAAGTVTLSGGGFGLIGLRERVTALGGTLQAGAAPDQGWQLAVRLPLHEGASQ